MNIIEIIKQDLEKIMEKLDFGKEFAEVTFSDRPELCDFQCNGAFALAKQQKCAPIALAGKIAAELTSEKYLAEAVMPGFVNIKLKDSFYEELFEKLDNDPRSGIEKNSPKKIVIDYGGANVAKPLHVGHLRSAVIGESLKRIAKFMGDEVISDVHLGDWGLQMGLTIAELMDRHDMGFYFGKDVPKYEVTMDELNEVYPAASAKSKKDEEFKKRAQGITAKLQKKEKGYYAIWKEIRRVSVEVIGKEYGTLNLYFDLWLGESDAEPFIETVLNIFEDKKLTQISDGATIVMVEKESDKAPVPPVIIKSSAGTDLYATTDLATLYMREKEIRPDEVWYITDSRQALHFEQVFRAARLAEIVPSATKLVHIPFGTINGTDGKPFRTREGGTVKLADLIAMLREAAEEKLRQNQTENEGDLAQKIGIAALKFGDLINYKSKDYIFDLEKFSAFEGKTGPYVQYSMVRIASILKKAGTYETSHKIFVLEQKEILKQILKMSGDFQLAYSDKAPSFVCASLYQIASSFSSFYNNVKIITEPDKDKRNAYLTLCELTLKTMKICMDVLAIDVPEKM